jgi:hypothetical protein
MPLLVPCVLDSTRFSLESCCGFLGSLLLHQLLLTPYDQVALPFNVLSANIQLAFKLLHASPGRMVLGVEVSNLRLEELYGKLQTG